MIIEINGKRKRIKGLAVYREQASGDYLYAFINDYYINGKGLFYNVFSSSIEGQRLPNCHDSAHDDYLAKDCVYVSWRNLPGDIREHLINYLKEYNLC